MPDIIDWANKNNGILNLVFAAIVALSAIATSWFNRRLTQETVELRRAETEPNVAVYLELRARSRTLYDVVVRNVGNGPAYNINFVLLPAEGPEGFVKLWNLGFIRNGIRYLAPGQEIRTLAGRFFEMDIGPISVDVNYQSASSGLQRKPRDFQETFALDIHLLDGGSIVGTEPDQEIAQQMKKLVEAVSRVQSGWGAVHVHVDSIRRRPEEFEWEREGGRFRQTLRKTGLIIMRILRLRSS